MVLISLSRRYICTFLPLTFFAPLPPCFLPFIGLLKTSLITPIKYARVSQQLRPNRVCSVTSESQLWIEFFSSALFRYFNTVKVGYHIGPIEERFEMQLTTVNGTLYATHYLAVRQSNSPNSPVLMLPVCRDLYRKGFSPDLPWPKEDDPHENYNPDADEPDVPVKIPYLNAPVLKLSLPVYPISVPHLMSLPLVLLFGLGLEMDIEYLPYRLLPGTVIAEFPAAPAMAEIFAKFPERDFERYHMYLAGFRDNSYFLGLKNQRIIEIITTAWKVATQARQIRQRQQKVLPQPRR